MFIILTKMNVKSTELITIKQAANMLGVTPLTLRNWDKNKKLHALRHPMNNYRVYRRADIEKLLKEIDTNDSPVPIRNKKISRKLQVQHLQ